MFKRKISLLFLIWLVLLAPAYIAPSKAAQFAISQYENYTDEYGNGIYWVSGYENSTGSWVGLDPQVFYYNQSAVYECPSGYAIKLVVCTSLNLSYVGATSELDGRGHIRHNITVYERKYQTVIFSQANLTYYTSLSIAGLRYYQYEVIIDYLLQEGARYLAIITYEVIHY